MNDTEREQWVNNDESLYNSWKHSRLSMTKFVRSNRAEIDSHIIKTIGYNPSKETSKPTTNAWMF
ncbi:MAG: hypothetical protein WC365_08790 [Candidatus Babeliales bacterium]|jgi:hypothetical protein